MYVGKQPLQGLSVDALGIHKRCQGWCLDLEAEQALALDLGMQQFLAGLIASIQSQSHPFPRPDLEITPELGH